MPMTCPSCRIMLETPKGVNSQKYGCCPKCQGRAFDFGLLSQQSHALYVLKLVKIARGESSPSKLRCPKCRNAMKNVLIHHGCSDCQVFWVDDFEADSKLKAPWAEMEKVRAKEKLAAQAPAQTQEEIILKTVGLSFETVKKKWQAIEYFVPDLNSKSNDKLVPAISYLSIAMILLTSVLPSKTTTPNFNLPESRVETFTDPETGMVSEYQVNLTYHQSDIRKLQRALSVGYGPNAKNGKFGKMLAAFFFHFSTFPLFLAIGILLLFGTKVEKYLGALRTLLVFASSAGAGYWAADAMNAVRSKYFLVGSMSGLSGILGFYSLTWILGKRAKITVSRPLMPILFGLGLVWQVSQINFTLVGYSVSYDTQPWAGLVVGALWALFLFEHPTKD